MTLAGAWERTGQPGSAAPAGFGSGARHRASSFPNHPGHRSPAESLAPWHFAGTEFSRERRSPFPKQEPCPLPAAVGSGCADVGGRGQLSPKSQILAPKSQILSPEERVQGAGDLILSQLVWYGVFHAALGSLHRNQSIAPSAFIGTDWKPRARTAAVPL